MNRAHFSLVSVKSHNNVSGCSDFLDLSALIKVSVYPEIDHSSENSCLFFRSILLLYSSFDFRNVLFVQSSCATTQENTTLDFRKTLFCRFYLNNKGRIKYF